MTDKVLSIYPEWKSAVKAFIDEDFKYGDTIPHSWFYFQFKIDEPNDKTTLKKYKEIQFKFMQCFKKFEEELLTEYNIHLENVRGVGYKKLPPNEQSSSAYETGMKEIRKVIHKTTNRLIHTDLQSLTAEERKENADLTAKFTMRASYFRKRNIERLLDESRKQIGQ